jgi:WD40 repeat protein
VTLSFNNWKEGKVRPTTHALVVHAPRSTAGVEPVADNLVATLVHPVRDAVPHTVTYSADGKRLFVAGYPSGVLQIFDTASYKELRRIETPSGYRSSAEYALVTPDWKTVYVTTETRKVKSIEKDGKQVHRIEESGRTRVWDLTTGEEQAPLHPPDGSAPVYAKLSPDGTALVCVERPSTDVGPGVTRQADVTVIWDLKTKERKKLADGFHVPEFTSDSKALLLTQSDYEAKTSTLRVLDAGTLKELAKLDCPEKERSFSLGGVSPDGSTVAVALGGKKGAPREVWFRDVKTLADRGRFVGAGDEDRYGWGSGRFTPDGKRYVLLNVKDKAVVWNVAEQKVERSFDLPGPAWALALSPDGRTLAVPWRSKSEMDQDRSRNPDPQDYPQPRVTLFDLTGKAAPRTLVVRHGFTGGVAFRPDGKQFALGSSGGVHLFDLTK